MSLQHQGISSEMNQNETHFCPEILQEMISSQLSGSGAMSRMSSLGDGPEHVNGTLPGSNSTGLNGPTIYNSGGFGAMHGQSALVNAFRNSVVNGNPLMNGRVGLGMMVQGQGMSSQSDMNNQAVNGFDNLQSDWKPSS